MKKLLPLILLFAGAAEAQVACVNTFFLPTDTSTFNLTCSGYGTPEGTIFTGNYVESSDGLNADVNDVGSYYGLGVTDYGGIRAFAVANAEDNVATTDTVHKNDDNAAYFWGGQGSMLNRRTISNCVTTTDGVTCTPTATQSTQYGGYAVNFHVSDCMSFSLGAGTLSGNTFLVTHGLGNAPTFGIFAYNDAVDGQGGGAQHSIGFMAYDGSISQAAFVVNSEHEVGSDSALSSVLYNASVGGSIDSTANTTITVSANNSTQTTFTVSDGTMSGDMVGLLCYAPTFEAYVGVIDSPDSAASDWTVTAPGFTPQFVMMAMTAETTVNTERYDSAIPGSFGLYVTDFTTDVTAVSTEENAAATSSTNVRLDSKGFLQADDQTTLYNFDNMTATSSGFQVTAANITTASATTHKWPTLVLGVGAEGSIMPLRRSRQSQLPVHRQ